MVRGKLARITYQREVVKTSPACQCCFARCPFHGHGRRGRARRAVKLAAAGSGLSGCRWQAKYDERARRPGKRGVGPLATNRGAMSDHSAPAPVESSPAVREASAAAADGTGKFADLVLEGGGVKGIGLAGAVLDVDKDGNRIKSEEGKS